jgi:large subunit ribosomal protein L20
MRIKRSVNAKKKRRKILKNTKGFLSLRRACYKKAKEALLKASKYAYRDRRVKKRERRRLWQIKINNAVRIEKMNYSNFINLLKTKKVDLDRKILANLAEKHPDIFKAVVKTVKK